MQTITNVSNVSDYSGETPITTPSNPVTTVIEERTPPCCSCYCCKPRSCCCCNCNYRCCCCRRYRCCVCNQCTD